MRLTLLHTAEVVANAHGFYDLDIEPDDRGVKIVASGHQQKLTVRGSTLRLAVDNLIEKLVGE